MTTNKKEEMEKIMQAAKLKEMQLELANKEDEANMHLFTHTYLEVYVKNFYFYMWPVGYPQFEPVFEKEVGINFYDNIPKEQYRDDLEGFAFIKEGFNRDIDKNGDLLEKLMPLNIGPFYVYYDVLIYGCNHDVSIQQNNPELLRVTPRGIR
jgi:hypothetical protein